MFVQSQIIVIIYLCLSLLIMIELITNPMKKIIPALLFTMFHAITIYAQNNVEFPLYGDKIPNSFDVQNEEKATKNGILRIEKVSHPTLTVFLPDKETATGTAVVICPGGGYSIVAIEHEGHDIAKKFVENGVAAFVLKYRLPNSKISPQPDIAPLQDAQQALITVRENADKWNINPEKVGIMGFSAGGHLASTAGTHFDKNYITGLNDKNVRPDFMILIYPVISSDKSITHQGSFNNLLGKNATDEQRLLFSNEKQITEQTPTSFLIHAVDDNAVPVQNSLRFAQALADKKISFEIHTFPKGGHGFGLNNPTMKTSWFDLCINWLHTMNF